ncbi:MAG: hypothetical protein ACRDLM_01875 [Gaiellaceae bacterium]
MFVATGLGIASYTTTGYEYQVWPQFFLEYVLRYSGRLHGDWATSFASPWWAVTHTLAWVPASLLSAAVFVLWLLSLGGVWLAFAAVCRAFGLSWSSVFGAGLVAASTGFTGLGLSQPVSGFFYPTELSFAFIVGALAAVLYAKPVLVGLFLGLAILVHPDMGVLGVLAVLPAHAVAVQLRPWRRHVPLALALLIPAAPAVYGAFANLALGSALPEHRRFVLLAQVRAPWHYLYRAFPAAEWLVVGGWALVFVVSLSFLPKDRRWRVLAATAIASVVVCLLGAIASQLGRPLLLVQLQTARLGSLLVLLGIVAAFAALHARLGRWTGAVGVLVFLLAPPLQSALLGIHHLPGRLVTAVSTSSSEAAIVLLVVLGLGWALQHETIGDEVGRRAGAIVFAGLLAAVALTLVMPFQNARDRDVALSPAQQDWIAVAKAGRSASQPRDVFLVPPAGPDLFALWSFRPVVATFSAYEFGSGDSEWIRRISIITGGDPRVFEPIRGYAAAPAQAELIESDYDHTVATSRRPICAFDVRYVVVESSVAPPSWLERLDATSTWDLYKVKPGTCARA